VFLPSAKRGRPHDRLGLGGKKGGRLTLFRGRKKTRRRPGFIRSAVEKKKGNVALPRARWRKGKGSSFSSGRKKKRKRPPASWRKPSCRTCERASTLVPRRKGNLSSIPKGSLKKRRICRPKEGRCENTLFIPSRERESSPLPRFDRLP